MRVAMLCVMCVGTVYCALLMCVVFFFNDSATTEIYTYLHTLSLHDALPISAWRRPWNARSRPATAAAQRRLRAWPWQTTGHSPRDPVSADRKSTRLNSSH